MARSGAQSIAKTAGRARLRVACISFFLFALAACTNEFETDPLVEFSTELVVQGETPRAISRQLGAGTYLVEVRERDIDLRVKIDAGAQHTELADAFLRHGTHRTVVSLESPGTLRLTLSSVDQRSWRGAAAVRILRWSKPADGEPPDGATLPDVG